MLSTPVNIPVKTIIQLNMFIVDGISDSGVGVDILVLKYWQVYLETSKVKMNDLYISLRFIMMKNLVIM